MAETKDMTQPQNVNELETNQTEEITTGTETTAPVSSVAETQTQETVEPVVIEPTIVEAPTQEPVQPEVTVEPAPEVTVEQPVEEVKVTEPTPVETKQPETKVETVQDIQAKETSNEAQENQLNETKKNQVVTEMQQMIQNGSTAEEIVAFGQKNNQFKDDINTVLRGSFNNASQIEYFGKYSTMTNDDMYVAYQNGEVVPGSDRYNRLPEAKRRNFENYLNRKDAVNLQKKTDFASSDNIQNFSTLESAIPRMFSSNVRRNYENALNTPERERATNRLNSVIDQLEDLDETIINTQEQLTKALSGNLPGSIRAEVNKQLKQLYAQKRVLLKDERQAASSLQTIKENAETQLKISMYEDGIAREQYNTELSLYETRRQEALSRQEKFEDREFTLKTQIQAEERQRAFTIEMKQLDEELKKQNKSGTYQTDREGNLLYLVDGKATKVKDSDGQVVGVVQERNKYSESIQKNSDGTYSIFRTYTDGRKPEVYNYGIDGNSNFNTQMGVYDAISEVDSTPGKYFKGQSGKLQCGEAVNRYLKQVGIKTIRMGDSYESKKKWINNNIPQVGGLAVWNPNAEGRFGEFGHTGMVTGYNPEKGEVEITDWNKNGNGEKNTYNIPVSQVLNSDGGFVHLEGSTKPEISGFNEADIPLYKKFINKGLTKTEQDSIENFDAFKQQALSYSKSLTEQGTSQIKRIIELAQDLKKNRPTRAQRLASEAPGGQLVPSLADYQASLQAFISNNALGNLVQLKKDGATFGALSNQELQFLEKSATELSSGLSDKKFDAELDRITNTLSKGLSQESLIESGVQQNVNTVTSFADYQRYKQTPTGSTQVNQDILDLYSNN